MSLNDVKQDEIEQAELDTQEDATLPDEPETDDAVAADPEDGDESESEYEIVEHSSEPSQSDDKQQKANARLAYQARKSKREAQEAQAKLERIKNGEIPDDMKEALTVAPELPTQPKFDDYFSDAALAKYDYDPVKAQAAYQADQNKWLFEAQNARAASTVQESQKRQQLIQQQEQEIKVRQGYEDAVEEMNLKGFDDAESAMIESAKSRLGDAANHLPFQIASAFANDKKQAVAVVNYLGKNPGELHRLLDMARDPDLQRAELYKLGYQKLQVTKRAKKPKPEADEPLSGGESSAADNGLKRLKKMFDRNDPGYRKAKKELEAKLGRRISAYDLR